MNENKVKINAIPIDFIKTKIEENRTSLYAESLNLLLREWADRKEEMSELIRCKDCRYYDASAKSMATLCTRKQGCRETIPEGFCGWAIPKMDEVDE